MSDQEELQEFISFAKNSTVLSDREAEVWVRSEVGQTNEEISDELGIGVKTVGRHKSLANDRIEKAEALVSMKHESTGVRRVLGEASEVLNDGEDDYSYSVRVYKELDDSGVLYTVAVQSEVGWGDDVFKNESYTAGTVNEIRSMFTSGEFTTKLGEASVVHNALKQSFDIGDLIDMFPETELGREQSIRNAARNSQFITADDVEALIDSISSSGGSTPFLGHSINGTPYFLDVEGSHFAVIGEIGSGKSYATKLYLERFLTSDIDANVVIADPLKGFTNLADYYGAVKNEWSGGDIEFGDFTYIDFGPAVSSNTSFEELLNEIGSFTQTSEKPVLVVLDEFHYFLHSVGSKEKLWDMLGGDNLYGVVTVSQTIKEFEATDGYDILGSDGAAIFRMNDLQFDGLNSELQDYIRYAKAGSADAAYSEALMVPPGSSTGIPVRVYEEDGERDYYYWGEDLEHKVDREVTSPD